MRVLLDHCMDRRVVRIISGHEVVQARHMGWERLRNGALVSAADEERFDAMVTVDKNLRYQQNLAGRRIAVVILEPVLVDFPNLVPLGPALAGALDNLKPGSFVVVRPAP